MSRTNTFPSRLVASGLLALAFAPMPLMAQGVPPAPGQTTPAPAPAVVMAPAASVLDRISHGVGITILADSTVPEQVAMPTEPTTAKNLNAQIAAVLKALPPSTRWIEVNVPKPQGGRAWNADDLVAYVNAQEKAFGALKAAPAGTVDILGQRLPAAKAQPILTDLSLQRVYLVTDPAHHQAVADQAANDLAAAGDWLQMPRAQQQQYMQQTAADILNMPENQRQPLMNQLKYFDLLKDEMEKQTGRDLGW